MQLTTQQMLVLEQTQRLYDGVDRTGEHLDNKAATVLQAGSLIIALTGATTLPAVIAANSSPWTLAALAGSFLLFITMVACAIFAWRPNTHEQPGRADWDSFFDEYISRERDEAYNQVLSNLMGAIQVNQAGNKRKARYVTAAAWLLALQVAGILVLAVAGALLA